MAKLASALVILSLIATSRQDINDNEVGDEANVFAEAAQSLFKDKNGPDLGGMLSSFMASEGGKHMGEMLLGGAGGGGAAADILQGIGNMVASNAGGGGNGGGAGLDMSMIGNVLSMLGNVDAGPRGNDKEHEGFDFNNALTFANSFMKQDGANDMLSYLPTIMNLFSAFLGPDAEKTAKSHEGHAWFLPPMLEKMHVIFDQFMNSNFGRDVIKSMGGEKFINIFADGEGNFSYRKFVDMLENHSFRRHWIKIVTSRIAEGLSYMADPITQQKYLQTAKFFINNFLSGVGIPKSALFDPKRPTESISALLSFLPKKYLNVKFEAKPYVKPAVDYAQEIMRMASHKGFLGRAVDSNELTHKLTDTINLEIIEPVARVNRAIRFAIKHPKCTKYVLCVANQHEADEKLSLPGLKRTLSRGVTLVASWYISGHANQPFWTLYGSVNDGRKCKLHYHEPCNAFHIEELKVTEEYVHNEL